MRYILSLFLIYLIIQSINPISPYRVLDLPQDSDEKQIRKQYTKLMSKKNTKHIKQLYAEAFNQIMLAQIIKLNHNQPPTFQIKQQPKIQISPLQKQQYQQDRLEIQRKMNQEHNLSIAQWLFFIGGCLVKLIPCVCICLMIKFRQKGPVSSSYSRKKTK